MKTRTFDLYSDPGHAWLKVPKSLLAELNLAGQITPCSYMRGDQAFLEEDQDLTAFVEALKARGVEVRFRDHIADRPSRVRGYPRYEWNGA